MTAPNRTRAFSIVAFALRLAIEDGLLASTHGSDVRRLVLEHGGRARDRERVRALRIVLTEQPLRARERDSSFRRSIPSGEERRQCVAGACAGERTEQRCLSRSVSTEENGDGTRRSVRIGEGNGDVFEGADELQPETDEPHTLSLAD